MSNLPPCGHPSNDAGFTLFEVLAAALVLVMVGVLTIGSMNTNLAHMSDARIRLEAGRIADAALADLEALLFDGTAPAIASEETELGDFRIATHVTPLGVLFVPPDDAEDEEAASNLHSMIAEEFPGLPRNVRVLHVRVAWGNPLAPEFVERTTIGFDHAAALEAFQQLGQNQAGEEAATDAPQ